MGRCVWGNEVKVTGHGSKRTTKSDGNGQMARLFPLATTGEFDLKRNSFRDI